MIIRRAAAWIPILLLAGCVTVAHRVRMVNVSVADLRAEPKTTATADTHDPLQETQLLYGERVRVRKVKDGWANVEALEQAEFTHGGRWQGYPGWLPEAQLSPSAEAWQPTIVVTAKWAPVTRTAYANQPPELLLPMGSLLKGRNVGQEFWRVEFNDGSMGWIPYRQARSLLELLGLSQEQRRRAVVQAAQQFLGDPYFWGGRSPHANRAPSQPTGVDCSGLVNLAYRSAGMIVPRDAHEQFLRAKRITTLQPADLIFLSEQSKPSRIVHVMLYAGGGEIIEGPGTDQTVRRIALAKRLGRPLEQLHPGDVIDGQTVFFGTYLP